MKITLEPTRDKGYPTASISINKDDLTLHDFFEELIIPALLAHGFSQQTIDDYLDDKEEL